MHSETKEQTDDAEAALRIQKEHFPDCVESV